MITAEAHNSTLWLYYDLEKYLYVCVFLLELRYIYQTLLSKATYICIQVIHF